MPPQPHINRPNTQQIDFVQQSNTTDMTTAVPSVEDVTNAFPTAVTKSQVNQTTQV